VLHSTDAFGTAGGKALSEALDKLGAPSVLDQGYANQSQDFTPVVLAIKQSGAFRGWARLRSSTSRR
jgi:branched-chain amino acid transport system substrate-binding protein